MPASRLRLFGLLAVVVLTAALPLAGASAGPTDDDPGRPTAEKAESVPADAGSAPAGTRDTVDDKLDGTPRDRGGDADSDTDGEGGEPDRPDSLLSGLGLSTAAQCGPQLSSPDGIEAQTCVLTQGRDTWARTYYRNATGANLSAVLTLMAPGGRTVQINCAVGAEDEPGMCETPRGRTRGKPARYAAVAEYATGGEGPLLLRSGSNSAPSHGG
ncbi:hypothetical protein V2W30_19630 [Streptomyces sp. Q6]|uniref:Uncharacterized protein n=1 Tax=Streptomyces citrinus TaxID=3118173 RepID=A0ACD5AEH9_9ACTN